MANESPTLTRFAVHHISRGIVARVEAVDDAEAIRMVSNNLNIDARMLSAEAIPSGLDVANLTMAAVEAALGNPGRSKEPVVSPKVAAHALWHLGDNDNWAIQPGRFEQLLFQLIDAADDDNKGRLLALFPEHTIALRDGRKHYGIDWLRKVAAGVPA